MRPRGNNHCDVTGTPSADSSSCVMVSSERIAMVSGKELHRKLFAVITRNR